MATGGDTGAERGLFASLKRLAETLIATLQTRLELLSTEAEERALQYARGLLFAVAALIVGAVGMLVATVFVIVLFWDTHRLLAIALVALAYLATSFVLARRAQRAWRGQPRLFAATLNELAKDREHLRGRAG